MPAPKAPALALAAVLALVGSAAVAGCGSSKSTGSTAATSQPSQASSTTANPANASSTTPPSTLFATGAVPAVSGADDLTKEPTISPGAGAPPPALTGKDLVVGKGTVAGPNASVTVQYVGALWSGKVFDASWTGSGPATFQLSGVIAGFKDAIIGMAVGGRREIVIPPAQGYGAAGQPPTIPPNSTLVFVIDLLKVQN
jgi:peptidylprolyl isomerase